MLLAFVCTKSAELADTYSCVLCNCLNRHCILLARAARWGFCMIVHFYLRRKAPIHSIISPLLSPSYSPPTCRWWSQCTCPSTCPIIASAGACWVISRLIWVIIILLHLQSLWVDMRGGLFCAPLLHVWWLMSCWSISLQSQAFDDRCKDSSSTFKSRYTRNYNWNYKLCQVVSIIYSCLWMQTLKWIGRTNFLLSMK